MKNTEVLDAFINGKMQGQNASKNLRIEGTNLINYSTVIAKWYQGTILISDRKYSSTTSKHQNYLKRNTTYGLVNHSELN